MKLVLVLTLCAFVTAAPTIEKHEVQIVETNSQNRNWLVNALVQQLINFIRNVINNGIDILGVPPLDPLKLESFHLVLPTGLINLDLDLKNVEVSGLGGFVMHNNHLDLSEISFDIDLSVPRLNISTEAYNLTGDLLTALPIYGSGRAEFTVEDFRLKAKLYLKQSENEKAVIIDRIERVDFDLPLVKANLSGAIGGGDIDHIVNAIIEEVLVDYVNRFRGAISSVGVKAAITFGNPILEQLDTWRFIAPLLPRSQ
ncbi:unnamed protein product, partial [Brenthis ino]